MGRYAKDAGSASSVRLPLWCRTEFTQHYRATSFLPARGKGPSCPGTPRHPAPDKSSAVVLTLIDRAKRRLTASRAQFALQRSHFTFPLALQIAQSRLPRLLHFTHVSVRETGFTHIPTFSSVHRRTVPLPLQALHSTTPLDPHDGHGLTPEPLHFEHGGPGASCAAATRVFGLPGSFHGSRL